jgi:hypothetical protein
VSDAKIERLPSINHEEETGESASQVKVIGWRKWKTGSVHETAAHYPSSDHETLQLSVVNVDSQLSENRSLKEIMQKATTLAIEKRTTSVRGDSPVSNRHRSMSDQQLQLDTERLHVLSHPITAAEGLEAREPCIYDEDLIWRKHLRMM